MRREAFVTDPVWMALSRHYGPRERVEILYVVGEATLTALAANSYGAERPKGAPAMPR